MRSVDFGVRAVMTALAVGITAIAAQPVAAQIEEVTIISPTETFEVSVGDDFEVAFDWSWESSEFGESYQADIYITTSDFEILLGTTDLDPTNTTTVVSLSVPPETLPGCYNVLVVVRELDVLTVTLSSMEDETDNQPVCIVGSPPEDPLPVLPVPVDIKPGSCPNPINMGKGGVVPVAIAGTEELDVRDIDPRSIRLMGVKPIRWNYEDVATPHFPNIDEPDCLDCTTQRGDGCLDLTLKFDAQELVEAIRWCYGDDNGDLVDRDCLILFLDGELCDGTPIAGEDVVRIQFGGRGSRPDKGNSDKDKSGKDKSGKDKSGKGKSGKGKSSKDKPGKGKPPKKGK